MFIKKFTNSYGEITAICRETDYLWIGYLVGDSSRLRKVSISNPELVYYDFLVSVTKINKIIYNTIDGYIYLSTDSDNYIGVRFDAENPLTTYTYYNKPVGVIENSVDIISAGSYVYFLTPGIESGINAKIEKYVYSGTHNTTIDLTTIFNAKKIDIDYSNILWVITNNDPTELVKVWYDTSWHYTNYTLS